MLFQNLRLSLFVVFSSVLFSPPLPALAGRSPSDLFHLVARGGYSLLLYLRLPRTSSEGVRLSHVVLERDHSQQSNSLPHLTLRFFSLFRPLSGWPIVPPLQRYQLRGYTDSGTFTVNCQQSEGEPGAYQTHYQTINFQRGKYRRTAEVDVEGIPNLSLRNLSNVACYRQADGNIPQNNAISVLSRMGFIYTRLAAGGIPNRNVYAGFQAASENFLPASPVSIPPLTLQPFASPYENIRTLNLEGWSLENPQLPLFSGHEGALVVTGNGHTALVAGNGFGDIIGLVSFEFAHDQGLIDPYLFEEYKNIMDEYRKDQDEDDRGQGGGFGGSGSITVN